MILKIKTYYDKKVIKIMKVIENVMYVLKKAIAEEVVFTEEHASIKNKSWYNYMISNEKYNRYMDMTWFNLVHYLLHHCVRARDLIDAKLKINKKHEQL